MLCVLFAAVAQLTYIHHVCSSNTLTEALETHEGFIHLARGVPHIHTCDLTCDHCNPDQVKVKGGSPVDPTHRSKEWLKNNYCINCWPI